MMLGRLVLALLLVLLPGLARAQITDKITATVNLIASAASDAACVFPPAASPSCLKLDYQGYGGLSALLTGSGTFTAVGRISADGGTTWTAVNLVAPDATSASSVSASGFYNPAIAQGGQVFLIRLSVCTSCSVTTILRATVAQARGGGATAVTSASTLTNTALVTGAGSRGVQTPAPTTTLDSAGNISTQGSLSMGVGGTAAGALGLTQGTAPSLSTTSVLFYAPTAVTSYGFVLPGAAGTGVLLNTNAANIVTQSFVGTDGTGSFARVTSPTFTASMIVSGLTASRPIITDASKSLASGAYSGNTTTLVTLSGSATSGTCGQFDASGNIASTGVDCGAVLFTATADGTNNATASDTSIIGTGVGSKTTAAGYFTAGISLRLKLQGTVSTAVTPDTLTINVKAGGVVVCNSAALSLTGALSASVFDMDLLVTNRTAGVSGIFKCNGVFVATGAALTPLVAKIADTGNAVNTTATITWDVTAAWGSTTAGDIITGTTYAMTR